MSFLLFATLASATETRLLLLYKKGVEEVGVLGLEHLGDHLADDPHELERWLLAEFGGLMTRYEFTYDVNSIARAVRGLDPAAPLLLDLPWLGEEELLMALLPFEAVFNLNGAVGAPGEVAVAYEYYREMFFQRPGRSIGLWSRWSDGAATRFAELLDRLRMFQNLAEAPGAGDPE